MCPPPSSLQASTYNNFSAETKNNVTLVGSNFANQAKTIFNREESLNSTSIKTPHLVNSFTKNNTHAEFGSNER